MNKCIVCECASVLYYEPPKERPPKKCPNCGRDTRNYTSMKEDDPRISILMEKYKSRLGEAGVESKESGLQREDADKRYEVNDDIRDDDQKESDLNVKENNQEENQYKKQEKHNNSYVYTLVSKDGKITISIPEEGGIIGRTAIGGEQLAYNGRISREHLKITPAKRAQGVMAEDISANGTFVDGRKLTKNSEEFAVIGSEITMGGEVFILKRELKV